MNKFNEPSMKGMLGFWILYLLKKRQMAGYEILQEISQITGDTWQPTTGSVYPALHKLKKNGIIAARKEGSRGKIEYKLTKKGIELYDGMRKQVMNVMQNAKFRRVFESLAWPDEPEELRNEIDALYTSLMKMRNNTKNYAALSRKIRRIREEISRK